KVGTRTYFHVSVSRPADLQESLVQYPGKSEYERQKLFQLPRLIPQDDKTSLVYPRLDMLGKWDAVTRPRKDRLEFVGQYRGPDSAKLLLRYRLTNGPKNNDRGAVETAWQEAELTLDFAKAQAVATPNMAEPRKRTRPVGADDIEGIWATAQATEFAALESQCPAFGC